MKVYLFATSKVPSLQVNLMPATTSRGVTPTLRIRWRLRGSLPYPIPLFRCSNHLRGLLQHETPAQCYLFQCFASGLICEMTKTHCKSELKNRLLLSVLSGHS